MNSIVSLDSKKDLATDTTLARIWWVLFPFLLFLLAFVPRAYQQVETYDLWHVRGKQFIEGLLGGDLSATNIAPHPGVTTMWLSGLTQRFGQILYPGFIDLSINEQMTIEIIAFAFVIAAAIVGAYFLMATVFDRQIAAVATLLLALDPYHIALSKAIHVDALVSVFMMLSALFLWAYAKNRRWMNIEWSGIFAGLGMLTKTPALFMVPYFGLVIGVLLALDSVGENSTKRIDPDRLKKAIKQTALAILVWFGALGITYALFWPALWIEPLKTLRDTWGGAFFFRDTPHPFPTFFLGQSTYADPGPLYYPVNMAVKTTIITLPGLLMSIPLIFNRRLERSKRLAIFFGLAFLVFFMIMMTLGEKKFSRYALPALQFIALLAGVGLVYFFRWLTRSRSYLLNIALVAIILVQAAVSLPRHPNYGTHYSYLFGGPKVVLGNELVLGQEKAEGTEEAAEYLNSFPLSKLLVVASQTPGSFGRYFVGKTVEMTDENVDYLVFTRSWVYRGMQADLWQHLWDKYQNRTPKLVVKYDGIPYVWVYKTGPEIQEEDIPHPVRADFNGQIRLLGYDFEPSEVRPGDSINLTLYWEGLQKPGADYTVFSHLLDAGDQLVGQKDNPPQGGMYPTHYWDQGERVIDSYQIQINPDALPGPANFAVGMYTLETLTRLPAIDMNGESLPDNRILLPGPVIIGSGP